MVRYPPTRAELLAAIGGVLTGAVLVIVLSLAMGGCGGTASAQDPGVALDPQTLALVRALEQSQSAGSYATPASIVLSTLIVAGAVLRVLPQILPQWTATPSPATDVGERLARVETKLDTLVDEVTKLRDRKHDQIDGQDRATVHALVLETSQLLDVLRRERGLPVPA